MGGSGSKLDEQALGRRLQAARQAAGLTQQNLCHQANLSYSTLAKIERGAIKAPSIFTIQAISEALGVSLDDLLGIKSGGGSRSRQLRQTKSGIRFIYFDVNGCLVRSYQGAFSKLAHRSGIPSDVIESLFWHYNDDVCRGTMSMADFNAVLSERLELPDIRWQDYYLESIEPVAEMHDLATWASEFYQIGLLSNIMPGLINAMRNSEILPKLYYDAIIDSSEVGFIKPETEIYQIATDRAGCEPTDILLIDDTRGNLPPAEKYGWHVLWFDYAQPAESIVRIREALEPAD